MGLFGRQSRWQRLAGQVGGATAVGRVAKNLELPDSVGRAAKAGLGAVGGLATITAASAVVSSLRRRDDE
jgi:hypothetical protein